MVKVSEARKYVKSDAEANNNKVWQYTVYDDSTMEIEYGRIGHSLQSDGKIPFDQKKLNTKIKEKTQPWNGKKGGYVEITVMAAPTGPTGPTGSTAHVKSAAVRDIAGADPVLTTLVTRLAEANKHEIQIASGGQMDIDLSTGIISTPVGVITKSNVDQARVLLGAKLQPFVKVGDFDNGDFKRALSDYLMLVPQRVGQKGWHRTFMPDLTSMAKQVSLLDQLEGSIELVEQRLAAAASAANPGQPLTPSRAFDVRLELMDASDPEFRSICKFYEEGKNDRHTSYKLKPIRGFRLTLPHMKAAYDADGVKMDNQWRLWHGSRVFNLLSIMKRGFVLPKQLPTAVIAGAMFGHGLYFSDQSTKSLNYSHGYWQGGGLDNNCFMFVVDVAMGKYHVPARSGIMAPPVGHDSLFAKGQQSGVLNNEMIVFRTGQANITHLIEFN